MKLQVSAICDNDVVWGHARRKIRYCELSLFVESLAEQVYFNLTRTGSAIISVA